MRRKNSLHGSHRTFVDSPKQNFDRIKTGREDNTGDRNSMKKCMEEMFSETAFQTASHWQHYYGKAWTWGLSQ